MVEKVEMRKALGETMPVEIVAVEKTKSGKYKVKVVDDEGDAGVLYLDVPIPKGTAELTIVHKSRKEIVEKFQ